MSWAADSALRNGRETRSDDGKIEKVYTLNDRKECNQLEQILEKMPLEYIQIANEIVEYASISLGKTAEQQYLFNTVRPYQFCVGAD